MTFPHHQKTTSERTIMTTISDIQQSLTNSYKLMNKQTYIGMLRLANTGGEILSILDAITTPVVEENDQLNSLAAFGRSDEIDF